MTVPNEASLRRIIGQYSRSFSAKAYNEETNEVDVRMDVFGIVPALKRENRQYWGRELGMCWQLIVTEVFRATVERFGPEYRDGADELCDLISGSDAIDTKYRIGSGDSGTLKKFKQYGRQLREAGYTPIFLILRTDNLPAAMTACQAGQWDVKTGDQTFRYIKNRTGVDLKAWLLSLGDEYLIER